MTPLEVEVVERKLGIIQQAHGALEEAGSIDLARYRADLWRRKGTERLLQEAIEAAIDVCSYLLVRAGRPAPQDFYSSFLDLAGLGAIRAELASALAPAAGLRNRLVHEYDAIDDAIVLKAVETALELLPRFIAQVNEYLARAGR